MKNRDILVIGGAGFIGSHLCEELIKNNNVHCLDNYLSGFKSNHVKGVSYKKGNSQDVGSIYKGYSFDYIFHLGEYSRVETSIDDYKTVIKNNLNSLFRVLEFTKLIGAKIIYSGSSTKFAETYDGYTMTPYTWTKLVNTQHVQLYASWFNIRYAITYFYNVYGGNEISSGKFSTIIAKYKKLIRRGATRLPVNLPGTQIRNFTHYKDLIRGLILVAENGEGDGYGIGSDIPYTINDLCELFEAEPDYKPTKKGNRLKSTLMTDKVKWLGWVEEHSLEEHIDNFLNEIKKHSK